MSAPTATKPSAKSAPARPANDEAALLEKMIDRQVEFVPFMGKEPIRLSPRMVMDFLCTKTKSGKVCDERQATRFVMLCKARGLNPWEGDAYIVGYDGKDGNATFSLITAHQAYLKRAEVHPEYDGMESGVLVTETVADPDGQKSSITKELPGDYFAPNQTVVGGWAIIHFKTRKHPMKKRLRLATFNKGFSRWNDDPAGMIVKCAEADALRSAFPNTLGGMYLDDEMPGQPEAKAEPELPTGRTSLRGNGEPRAPLAPDIPPEPPPPDPEALEKQTAYDELSERIGNASSGWDDIAAEIGRKTDWLGQVVADNLMELLARRRKEVEPRGKPAKLVAPPAAGAYSMREPGEEG